MTYNILDISDKIFISVAGIFYDFPDKAFETINITFICTI